jgi:arylsulfatase A-like enzyme
MRKASYQTAMVGKWHLKTEPTGFDFWEVRIGQGPYCNPQMRTPQGNKKYTGYTTEIITDIALNFLKNKRDKEKPFVLMYQHKAPHRNWAPGTGYLNMYDDVTIPEPATLFDKWENRTSAAKTQTMTVERHLNANDLKLTTPRGLTKEQLAAWNAAYGPKNEAFRKARLKGKDLVRWKYQRYIKDYLRCIASVDDNIGRVLDYLDDEGLTGNTIVIYSSDQGFYHGDHGWFDKRWMYEESLRMPLIVRWPGSSSQAPPTITSYRTSTMPKPSSMSPGSPFPMICRAAAWHRCSGASRPLTGATRSTTTTSNTPAPTASAGTTGCAPGPISLST